MSTADSEREIYINIEFRKKQERVYSDSAQLLISYAQQLIGKDQASLDLQQKVVDWSRKCGEGKPDYTVITNQNICFVEYMVPLVIEKNDPNHLSEIEREKSFFFHCWERIKGMIAQESQWEQSVAGYLHNVAEEHPLIARFIASVLSGILIGTLTDCVVDGVKKPEQEEHYQKVMEEMEEILHLEKDDEITLTKEKDGYKVIIKNN